MAAIMSAFLRGGQMHKIDKFLIHLNIKGAIRQGDRYTMDLTEFEMSIFRQMFLNRQEVIAVFFSEPVPDSVAEVELKEAETLRNLAKLFRPPAAP